MRKPVNDARRAFIAVGAFFSVVIAANITLIYLAVASNDGLVEDNYYKRGLNYQDEKDRSFLQDRLGWQVDFKKDNSLYTVSAKDKNGNSISKAKVKLTFFRPTQSGFDQSFYLPESEPGVYVGSVNLSKTGIWDVYIEVEKEKRAWKNKQRITN